MVHPVASDSLPLADSSLRAIPTESDDGFPIDPALYTIQDGVDGKERLRARREPHQNHEIKEEDDGIDPALREIVNSLTNAQQVSLRPLIRSLRS